MARNQIIVATAAAMFACAGIAHAAIETTVYTDADASIYSSSPLNGGGATENYNYGAAGTLQITERYTGNPSYKFYTHFDLSGLDMGKPVTGARLKLDRISSSDDRRSARIFAVMDEAKDWDLGDGTGGTLAEGAGAGGETPAVNDITWLTAPQNNTVKEAAFLEEGSTSSAVTRLLGVIAHVDLVAAGGIDLDVTDFVQWVMGQNAAYADAGFDQSDGKISILVRHNDTTYSGGTWSFHSKEGADGTTTFAPRIEVTQTPEPATLAVLALGSPCLAARRRRRK
jgi:hypothetical protein